jgi:hypothetical protein
MHDPELRTWSELIRFILWHVDPLLGNYTTAAAK